MVPTLSEDYNAEDDFPQGPYIEKNVLLSRKCLSGLSECNGSVENVPTVEENIDDLHHDSV